MKVLAAGLLLLLLLLQYRLWFGAGSLTEVKQLHAQIAAQREENAQLRERNRTLAAEVQDLKKGTSAIEERARTDLGMIGRAETFYQVVSPKDALVMEVLLQRMFNCIGFEVIRIIGAKSVRPVFGTTHAIPITFLKFFCGSDLP